MPAPDVSDVTLSAVAISGDGAKAVAVSGPDAVTSVPTEGQLWPRV